MSNKDTEIYFITGPCGVGKSTIAKLIASNMKSSALIEGDNIYNMVIGGYVKPWKDNGTYLELFWENVAVLIENFLKRNITVVIDYIIYPEHLKKIVSRFKEKNVDIKYTVLLADKNTILQRDNSREPECRMGERSIELLNDFRNLNIEDKYIIDTTSLSKNEISNMIITNKRFIL